jgi:hypothetical protein
MWLSEAIGDPFIIAVVGFKIHLKPKWDLSFRALTTLGNIRKIIKCFHRSAKEKLNYFVKQIEQDLI